MNDNVRKIFDLLGVEPNEKFKITGYTYETFYITSGLSIIDNDGKKVEFLLQSLLNGMLKIIKLPKKKKLRDLTPEEWDKWKEICSYTSCSECIFRYVSCIRSDREECWVNHKDLYSDKFLDQEIEVEDDK